MEKMVDTFLKMASGRTIQRGSVLSISSQVTNSHPTVTGYSNNLLVLQSNGVTVPLRN
jgi:hypothetical protein